jgi:ketosteroid isomerase-like protein
MTYLTPAALFDAVVDSRKRNDLATYLGCYEHAATIVPQPGAIATGQEALRNFFAFYQSMKPTFTVVRREFIEGPEITLHLSAWTLTGTDSDGKPFTWEGRTTDVLRKQSYGNWLVSLDNPWGTALLDPAA